jgi:GH24 family phage-related lysozyme (muramidase)
MNRGEIREWIERWEGRRSRVYTDTRGHPTIGVGFNLDRPDARGHIEDVGLDYDQVRAGLVELSDSQIDRLFDADVDRSIADARTLVANFDSIPETKQKVVVDMVFNLGARGFAAFRNTINAIEQEDWQRAAREMKDSRWYGQVGNRAPANVAVMGAGV